MTTIRPAPTVEFRAIAGGSLILAAVIAIAGGEAVHAGLREELECGANARADSKHLCASGSGTLGEIEDRVFVPKPGRPWTDAGYEDRLLLERDGVRVPIIRAGDSDDVETL